ncbi:MAG: hypothetical protein BGP06_03130 [Rhizobiales bacterium 65-9]|nr:esterase [Hyphomicrobiales bacterium]OJY35907.1 MAG: hypothetical protein BGP06_03130 [Rhizobiales bacterium 65-9]
MAKAGWAGLAFTTVFGAALATAGQAAEVVALGASNTAGRGRGATPDGVDRPQAYPAQLERLLQAQGCRVRVANAGVAGNTTAQMLARLPKALGKDTRVLILQPGGNDQRRGGGDTGDNVEAIKQFAAARGVAVVMFDQPGRIAGRFRLPDGQHFSAEGHALFASHLAPQVVSAGACR